MKLNQTRISLLVILLLALALRLYELSDRSLWFDEGFTMVLVTDLSWSEMFERITRDVHPPLYYFILRIWIALLGDGESTSRFLSVIFGVLTVYVSYLLGKEVYAAHPRDEAVCHQSGLITAALMTLSSAQIRWSQELRMYSLGIFLAVICSWCLLKCYAKGFRSFKWNTWYVITATSLLYTHNYGLFTIASHGVFLFGACLFSAQPESFPVRIQDRLKAVALPLVLIAILYTPWLPVLLGQTAEVHEDYWIRNITWRTVPEALGSVFVPIMRQSIPPLSVSLTVTVFLLTVLFILCRKITAAKTFLVMSIVGPIALSVILSVVVTPIIHYRFYLFLQPFVLAGLAIIVASIMERILKNFLIVFVSLNTLLIHLYFLDSYQAQHRSGNRGVAAAIQAYCQPGQIVVVTKSTYLPAFKYYLRNSPVDLFLFGTVDNNYSGKPVIRPDDYINASGLAGQKQIWVVGDCERVQESIGLESGSCKPIGEYSQNWSNSVQGRVLYFLTIEE